MEKHEAEKAIEEFRKTMPADWDALATSLGRNLGELRSPLLGRLIEQTLLAAYVEARCQDLNHKAALRDANRVAREVAHALGFTFTLADDFPWSAAEESVRQSIWHPRLWCRDPDRQLTTHRRTRP